MAGFRSAAEQGRLFKRVWIPLRQGWSTTG